MREETIMGIVPSLRAVRGPYPCQFPPKIQGRCFNGLYLTGGPAGPDVDGKQQFGKIVCIISYDMIISYHKIM